MDKTAIKNYAVEARRKLIEVVRQKAFQLYIFEDGALPPDEAYHCLQADSIFLTSEQKKARSRLTGELAALGHSLDNEKAYQHVMEEVAYTWFNRLIALRFMEVNNYLPSGIRILSSVDKGRIEPDAMREAERLDYVDQAKIAELRVDTGYNASEKLYKYILISQCNALSSILPGMFEKINDYTELLLPDALYTKGGIVHDLVNAIDEDDFRNQVQIIGWLYQFYISEKKDEVFAGLKKNIKINKETIPAATQLFTPEWIVKYMVENSLGRLWLEQLETQKTFDFNYVDFSSFSFGEDKDKSITKKQQSLKSNWKYYIEEAEQAEEVKKQLYHLHMSNKNYDITSIKLIDPCMGSGHILVYAFDVFYQIYLNQGYAEREIPNLILENNIYGLDIDDRAGQLTYFALMMKARSYNRRFFRQENIPNTNVYAIPETISAYLVGSDKFFGAKMTENEKKACHDDLMYLVKLFENGKEYGSALKIEREIDYVRLRAYIHDHSEGQMTIEESEMLVQVELLGHVINVALILSQKYDVVVTNPPYMGGNGMGAKLSEYVKKEYPDSKSDMSTVFMEKALDFCKVNGYMAMINIPVWMFLSSYEKLREKLLNTNSIINMIHFGRGVFGADFGTTSFVFSKKHIPNLIAIYRRLFNKPSYVDNLEQKEKWFFSSKGYYTSVQERFINIPTFPIAYWISDQEYKNFVDGQQLNTIACTRQGFATGNNERFLKLWHEVSISKIGFGFSNREEAKRSGLKWFPCNKGGSFRKWYGNNDFVADWEDDGQAMRNYSGSVIRNPQYYFREGLTWSSLSISSLSMRYSPRGHLFESKGSVCFLNNERDLQYVLGALNSIIVNQLLLVLCPTVDFHEGPIGRLPILIDDDKREIINELVNQNISISRTDWDCFENSWDFQSHPLADFQHNEEVNQDNLLYADDIQDGVIIVDYGKQAAPINLAYDAWERFTDSQFSKLKANEEELNRIFIEIYGLQDELTSEVEDKDVTIRKADLGRDIRSFLSYAVGCMFGRYSLDEPGLVYAGGQLDMSRYKTFLPEDDNIIPIGSADYFDDDIVVRFTEFVRTVYGDATIDENLNFIANALYPNGGGSAKDKIRRYFLNDFYKDHVKIYQKRPIYWLLESGKKDGFKALIYLHRYDKYTIARARTDYLHPLQHKYEAEIKRLEMLSVSTDNAREKAAYRKEIETLQGKIEECRVYDQVVAHIAHQQIELDLDDGVVANYAKFQDVKVPRDNGKTETMDLLAKM